jgi:anti-sigma-K factor RskA
MTDRLDCDAADELGAAFALGALDTGEAGAVADHLATCAEPHVELRSMLGAEQALALSRDPVAPSRGLRDRLMSTVARTTQDHVPAPAPRAPRPDRAERRGWLDWISPRVARPLAVAAIVAVAAVAGWNVTLQSQVAERDRALRAVAAAISGGETAIRVDGSAGRGYLVETPGSGAALVVADLGALPADRLYELWLLDAGGTPVAVGTFTPGGDAVAVVALERDLSGFATFAVTVEPRRLDAPTGDVVMEGHLSAS